MTNINEEALIEVDWILQESYKRANKMRGIGDWSNFKSVEERDKAEREVEQYQLDIATLIQRSLYEARHLDERKKFDERMDAQDKRWAESDAKFDKKYGTDEDDKGFTSYSKDDLDKRDTSDIGKQ
jgi:hypothetical protein